MTELADVLGSRRPSCDSTDQPQHLQPSGYGNSHRRSPSIRQVISVAANKWKCNVFGGISEEIILLHFTVVLHLESGTRASCIMTSVSRIPWWKLWKTNIKGILQSGYLEVSYPAYQILLEYKSKSCIIISKSEEEKCDKLNKNLPDEASDPKDSTFQAVTIFKRLLQTQPLCSCILGAYELYELMNHSSISSSTRCILLGDTLNYA